MNFRRVFGPLFHLEVEIAIGVFAVVVLTLVLAVVLFRDRDGRRTWKRSKHTPLEVGYALVVAATAGFLIVRSTTATAAEQPSGPAALTVDVTAYQWCWTFGYPGHSVTVSADCVDGDVPVLVLPVGEKVRIDVTSTDVIHNFWVPYLKFKVAAFPDFHNRFDVVLTGTGRWPGRCAEFCGLHHDTMDFWLQAVTPAQFRTWLAARGGRA